MQVYVINQNGHPLMPCTPAKARKLMRDGKAKVAGCCPFTIQLLWDCEECVQDVTLGIDKGSKISGIACVGNGEVLLAAELHHRLDVKEKLDTRRTHRKGRRARTWYRPSRFANRASSRRSRRLPPSIKTNVEEVIRVVRQLPIPISHIIIEDVQVDIARLNNPTLSGIQYQDRTRLDENLRIACLMRDGYQCQQCGKQHCRLEAHHLVYRQHGGKDTLANLLALCEACHHKVHRGELTLKATGVSGHLDVVAQHTMQGKAYLYSALGKLAWLNTIYGYQTSAYRKARGLPKTHLVDALCIATLHTEKAVSEQRENSYTVRFRPRQIRRRYHSLPRKGRGRVRYQVNGELAGLRKGDMVRVKGNWVKQINALYGDRRVAFERVKGEPSTARPKDCRLLKRNHTIVWQQVG